VTTQKSHWASLTASALTSVVVGFASTILVVLEGISAAGATPAQQASAASILCLGMAITSFILAWQSKIPIIIAWSTPGAVLIATSGLGTNFAQAVSAFIFAGVLMVLTAFIKPLARAIANLPSAIAAAMLAGVLLRYVLNVPLAGINNPVIVAPIIFAFFALRLIVPLFAVPIIVAVGVLIVAITGTFTAPIALGFTRLEFVMPQWHWPSMVSLGLPLYLVTMASQNVPGFAVLKSFGYSSPIPRCLTVTGMGSIVAAFFGGHALNMSAITAAIVAGPDTHPKPDQRWKAVYPYSAIYVVVGLTAGASVSVLSALPKDLVTAIAGLALFGPLLNGMAAMTKDPKDIDAALVNFIVTASGSTLFGIGAAFWGLLAGVLLWGAKRLRL
jgi:benzoate membrane transport protein